MAKLLPNRIDETLTDEQIKQFTAGIQMAIAALPKKRQISSDDYDKIPKKADARIKEADELIKVVRKFSKFLPGVLTAQNVENDNTLYDQLYTLRKNELSVLVALVDQLIGLSGGEEMNAYGRFIENVKIGVNDGDPDAIEAQNELDAIARNKASNVPPKKPEVAKS